MPQKMKEVKRVWLIGNMYKLPVAINISNREIWKAFRWLKNTYMTLLYALSSINNVVYCKEEDPAGGWAVDIHKEQV